MEQLIDLLLKFIVSNKTICKDIQATVSEISSEDFSEENLLYYYDKIPSEEMSLIYACLAKILRLKEYLLYKDIEKIAKTWDEIKVGPKPFNVHYVMNGDSADIYKKNIFSGKLYKCLSLVVEEDDDKKFKNDKEKKKYEKKIKEIKDIKDDSEYKYEEINDQLKKIVRDKNKVPTAVMEQKMAILRENGKCNCQILNKIAELIYDKWKELYKDSNDDHFLDLFKITYTKKVDGKKQKVTEKDIGKFFQAFLLGVDCSGYANQVYGQWMLDLYTQWKLNSDEIQKKMIETIGPDSNGTKCRDNAVLIREDEVVENGKKVEYSTYHIGYFFLNKYLNNQKGEKNRLNENKNYKRNKTRDFSEDGDFNSEDADAAVKSNLKAGDLICFEHNEDKQTVAHFAIVEKTGINEKGQWYFCTTESTTKEKIEWMKDPETGEIIKNRDYSCDGVRHNQGHYISIEDYMELRESKYEFFWFCRPKAIVEYYDNIIEYKENES